MEKRTLRFALLSQEKPERAKIALTVGKRIDKVERDPYFVGAEE
ncbi:hypothetical protein [Lacrimispora saccharolytica]|nr:hypothetical protein [Lacrimispora saccharolytica]